MGGATMNKKDLAKILREIALGLDLGEHLSFTLRKEAEKLEKSESREWLMDRSVLDAYCRRPEWGKSTDEMITVREVLP